MENESTDNRNYTTLRDFVARCLRKNKHLSADSLFRTGEEVPLPDLPLKLKDLDSVIDSIFADRFLRLIQDLADYGRRGIYEFEAEEKGPVYEQEERWLNGDLSDLGISPLRGKRSSRPETRMDRESFGSCLARLVKESAAKNLSRRSLEWLTSTFDYNLDWLFFGVGEMVHSTFQSIYEPAQMAHDEEGENGSVTHTGDNRTGEGEGDDEVLYIDFTKVPADVERIAITVTIYEAQERGQNFGQVSNAYVRLARRSSENDSVGTEELRYDLGEDFSVETALVVCELYRSGATWKFNAVGAGYQGGLYALCKAYGVNV